MLSTVCAVVRGGKVELLEKLNRVWNNPEDNVQ
jgi:hypothetical protein